jgi:PAS domain S-box-containing protein
MEIVNHGRSIGKLIAINDKQPFDSLFKLKRPKSAEQRFEDIKTMKDEMFFLEFNILNKIVNLRGQFEYLPETNQLIFLGSPWLHSVAEIAENELLIGDFATHDASIDLLHVLNSKTIAENDSIQLIQQLNEERNKFKHFALITEETINGGVITDSKGKIIWVNKAFEKITGYTLEECVGKSPGSLLQGMDSDPETIKYLKEQITEGKNFECEIINYHKNGNAYWVKVAGHPIFDQFGNLVQFFALEEDITERKLSAEKIKASEERWKFALEGAGEGVWEYNFQTEKSFFSPLYEKLLGYNKEEMDLFSRNWQNLVHEEDYHIILDYDKEYFEGLILNHKKEYRIRKKDGNYIWVLDRGMLMSKTVEGKPLKIIGTHTDITDLKEVELSLEQSEKQFRSLSENLPGVVYEFVFPKNGTPFFKFISPSVEKIFGVTADQFNAENSLLHPDDRERLMNCIEDSGRTNCPFYFEGRFVIPGKGNVWHSSSSSFSYKDLNGDSVFTGIMLDITEKKSAEDRLEKQREFYEQVLNKIPSDIAVFDNEHRYLFLNPVAIKNPELRQWMIGKKDEDYCRYRNKPIEILEGRRALFNSVLEAKKLVFYEETLTDSDGNPEYHLRNMYPVLDQNGEVTMVIGYGVNITDRKNIENQMRINEKRYRDLFNFSQALICTHDQNGVLLSVNPSICSSLGYSSEEMVGKSLGNFMQSKDAENLKKDYLDIINQEGKGKGVFRALSKSGKRLYLLFQNYLVEEKGLAPYIIGFSQDITERVQAENELLIAKQFTEDVSKAKEIFLANMSHEIRTPMNGILGVANLLAKTQLGDQQKGYLKLILESANNLLVIVNDVLDIEKIASGRIEFEQIPFLFEDRIRTSIQSFQYKVEEKGLLMVYNSPLEEDLVLVGDPFRLSQIFNNLLNNAIKFTKEGKISVDISIVNKEADKMDIRFSITDTGIGIDEERLGNIFEPFVQASTDTTRKFGGTGLGLSICKDLVEMQGGQISVNSVLNQGTTFEFQLPFTIGIKDMLNKEDMAPEDYSNLGYKHILVAEDVELNQFIARQILETWGMKVTVANNGKEAVELVSKEPFDLILMDIQMPEMDGIEATQIIRKVRDSKISQMPIVALTANALKGDNVRYIQAGMNDYITKPYTEAKLYSVISKYLKPDPNSPLSKPANSSQPSTDSKPKRLLIEESEEKQATTGEKLYDLSMVELIGKGNPGFINKMVSLFLEQVPKDLEKMNEYSNNGEWEHVSKLAHRMKPSIEGMGINSLKEPIREIETRTRQNEVLKDSEILEQVSYVNSVMEKVVAQLSHDFLETLSIK